MADTKVSALAAATVVAAANEFPINEAGVSKKVTGTQIRAFTRSDPLLPGTELVYVEFTADVAITAGTVEATAVSIVSAGAYTFDGTAVLISCYIPNALGPAAVDNLRFWLYDGGSSIGEIGRTTGVAASAIGSPQTLSRRMTPSAVAHTYSIRASAANVSSAGAGAGGAGVMMPGFIRITKV